jgi:hypothetical protein
MNPDIEIWDLLSDTTRVAIAVADGSRDVNELGLDEEPFVAAIAEALEVESEQVEGTELKHPNCESAAYPACRTETSVPREEIVFRVRAAITPLIQQWEESDGPRVMIEVTKSVKFIETGPTSLLEQIAWAAK